MKKNSYILDCATKYLEDIEAIQFIKKNKNNRKQSFPRLGTQEEQGNRFTNLHYRSKMSDEHSQYIGYPRYRIKYIVIVQQFKVKALTEKMKGLNKILYK